MAEANQASPPRVVKHKRENPLNSGKKTVILNVFNTFCSSNIDVECPITVWRRTEIKDVKEIKKLIKVPQTTDLFGDRDVEDILEMSNLSLCQENSVGRIVSYISLSNHPNIPVVPPKAWLEWAHTIFGLERVTVHNTFFIHYLVWSPNYSNDFLKLLLHTIFITNYYIQHILLVIPPDAKTADVIGEYFQRLLPVTERDSSQVQTLMICMRQHHVPQLRIRKALEEDNDDVIPILEKQNEDLRKLYGDFYIAEMVANPDHDRKMVVAEHNERAIGFMSMNCNIDFDMLNIHFELSPFYGLRKPHEDDDVLSPSAICTDSIEGIILPSVIRSGTDLSRFRLSAAGKVEKVTSFHDRLSVLSSVVEQDLSFLLQSQRQDSEYISGTTEGSRKSLISIDSMESIIFEESLTLFSEEDIASISISEEEEKDEESLLDEGRQEQAEEPFFRFKTLNIPTYCGEPNAFMIELFAMHEDWDERMSADFLEAAFECYPDLDYCIMTIPPTCITFPLLDHFTRVPQRPTNSFNQELYVCHRNAIISQLSVRYATIQDIPVVRSLITLIKNHEQIFIDFEAALMYKTSKLTAFVILSESDIVGIAIVMPQEDILYLQSHYNIEAHTNLKLHRIDQHGTLKHFTLSPIFGRHFRFFLSEIMRLSDFTSLYYLYCNKCNEQSEYDDESLVTSLSSLVPLMPRRQIHYDLEKLEKNSPCPSVLKQETPYALYYMNKPLSSLPKYDVNIRIVIVGASDTALSFLKNLLFGPSSTYLTFTNITLVSPHGLPGECKISEIAKKLFVYNGQYGEDHMEKLNLRTWVNIIYGKMTGINKKEKYITINHTSMIQYDYLMLFCGELFHLPAQHSEAANPNQCVHGRRKSIDEAATEVPTNVFLINTDIDAANSMIALKYFVHNKSHHPPIIVYGSCLEAYCCVAALQEFGIKGHKICFVEPIGNEAPSVTCFNDKEVDDAVVESLRKGNITHLSGYYLMEWKFNKSQQIITKAKFESKTRSMTVECLAMFYYGNRCVNRITFLALEQGQLVYDGALVINANFRTSDKYIYAGGTFTKYARRYYGQRYFHRYYNSREIGQKMTEQMLKMWDPTQEGLVEIKEVPPTFTQPLVKSCLLPGKKYYLKICKPGITVPLEAAMSQENYGFALVTGDCKPDSKIDYFRIHVNAYSMVETITCYSKEKLDVESYIALYGLHERMLNNMVIRFETGYITDFYAYFKERWCYGLIHDRFHNFTKTLSQVFLQTEGGSFSPFMDSIRLYFSRNNWKKMNLVKREEFKMQYRKQYEKKIQDLLLKFLSDNGYHLPMYAHPDIVKRMLHGYETSIFFQKPDGSLSSSSDESD